MTSQLVKVSLWSNSPDVEIFLSQKQLSEISFCKYDEKNRYLCFLIDTDLDLKNVSQKLIEIYLKARENNSKIIIVLLGNLEKDIEKYLYFKNLLIDIGNTNPVHRLVFCHDLFLLNHSSKGLTSLDRDIQKILQEKQSTVSQKGNYYYSPLLLDDFLVALKKILFQNYSKGENYFLQGESISDLDLSYLISDISREYLGFDIDINSTKKSETDSHQEFKKNFIETQSNLNWQPSENFEVKLKDFIKNYSKIDNGDILTSPIKTKKQSLFEKLIHWHKKVKEGDMHHQISQKIKQGTEKVITLVLVIYLFTSLFFFYSSYKTLTYIEKSLFYLRKGSFESSVSSLNTAKKYYKVSNLNYSALSPIVKILDGGFDKTNQNFLGFVSFSINTLENIQQLNSLGNKIYLSFNQSENKQNYQDLTLALKSNLQQTYESVNQIEILLTDGNLPSVLLQKIKQNVEYKNLKTTQEQLLQISKIIDVIPSAFNENQSKNIFIVFQNSREMRPTGGVIEYVQQFSLEGGRVVSQHLYSSQEIDKKDEFQIPAPPLIEKVTGEANWRLRDMNYNPDYPQTATNIAWYLEKKLKVKPDLIISIDRSFVESFLKNHGEVDIGGTKVSSDIYMQTYNQVDVITKPLLESIFSQLLNHQPSISSLVKIIYQSLEENHLFVWVEDQNIEKSILGQSFAGAIRNYSCHSGVSSSRDCLAQTSHLNISNFSLLPVNSYLKHHITHKISLNNQGVDHLYDIQYEYLQQTPLVNRELVEIIQLYIPSSSILEKIILNGQEYPLNQILFQKESTLDRYQFIISTPLGQKSNLQIKYSVQEQSKIVLPIAFSFTEIPQSKSGIDPHKLEFLIPDSSRVSAITSEAESKPDQIIYEFPSKTSTFGLNLVPKLQ